MTWNIEGEFIAVIIVSIIFFNSIGANMVPSFKNKIFNICLGITLLSIMSNIFSTFLIQNNFQEISTLTFIVTTIYFIMTPLVGVLYTLYIISISYEDKKNMNSIMILCSLPYLLYLIMVLINPYTNNIFFFSNFEYNRGPYIGATYFIFYAYCCICIIIVFTRRKFIDKSVKLILYCFPFISFLVILIQQFIPHYVLTGSSATCALLIIYLSIQNKQISLDQLTKISNKQILIKLIELKLKRKEDMTIVVISLSGFKYINDKFGYQVGDTFIKEISNYLKKYLKNYKIFRYGGDEFAFIVNNLCDYSVLEVINDIKIRFLLPWVIDNYTHVLSIKIGIAESPKNLNGIDEIMNCMQYALHNSSENTTDNIIYCSNEMIEKLRRKNIIIETLKEKVLSNDFIVYFQPIYSVKNNKFIGAESLLRLYHKDFGYISPIEFIPIAEETGLIIDMTYQVLDKACKFIKRLHDNKVDIEAVTVNLSVIQFLQKDLADKILQIIEKNQVSCSQIKFEITESILISDYDIVKKFIFEMQKYKIKFALDDFGTGYSNISTVIDLPFEVVKLDKSLIWASMDNKKCATFVKAISKTFDEIGIRVLSEGIETDMQFQYTMDIGCDLIQGYLFAKPMSSDDAEKAFTNIFSYKSN